MTPEQIERIRKAAEELEAALSDTREYVDLSHSMIDVTTWGDGGPKKYVHTIELTAVSTLRIFP